MGTYLTFIGVMNMIGALLLLGAQSDPFADGLLRRWTYLIPQDSPFRHAPYGRLWLWWATIGTGFFGALNLVAASWPEPFARVVVYGNVYVYSAFEALAIAGSVSCRYGPGLVVAHGLWVGQAGWGVFVALSR